MQDKERQIAEIVINVMTFYSKPLSPMALDTWVRYLSRYEVDQVSKAFDAHMLNPDSGMFEPRPAHIEALLRGTSSDKSSRAWAAVNQAISSPGVYYSVVFDDPIIHLVVEDMGGWARFGIGTYEDMKYIENHFKTAYKGYASRADKPQAPRKLIGISEMNTQKGRPVQAPMFIGDAQKCQRIYESGRSLPKLHITDSSKLIGTNNVIQETAAILGVNLESLDEETLTVM